MRLLLILAAALCCAASATTTLTATATVQSYATLSTGPGYIEFASNDPDAAFLIGDQPVLAGTYDTAGTRMADGWRPSDTYLAER